MKIACKCGKPLTKDLRKAKGRVAVYIKEEWNEFSHTEYHLPPLSFHDISPYTRVWDYGPDEYHETRDCHYTKVPAKILVLRSSMLPDIIPPMPSGYGCCDWSGGASLKCECGNKVAELYLDCYERGEVYFFTNMIRRVYK